MIKLDKCIVRSTKQLDCGLIERIDREFGQSIRWLESPPKTELELFFRLKSSQFKADKKFIIRVIK